MLSNFIPFVPKTLVWRPGTSFCHLASLTPTKAAPLSGHKAVIINLISRSRISQRVRELVHMTDVLFAAYKDSQTCLLENRFKNSALFVTKK